ncbi:MAG: 5-amino-6-(D-ribitylamino)uracil--L-tyrosine 4-hydroxyphenyl transferase CofH [Actinomycetia bacterium]|nr:5-amino-6-(D-ribitylamino)uracil--L-tyrosine 4-hydroxyphenyl transferase CofH [Actinomycetes bacterium]
MSTVTFLQMRPSSLVNEIWASTRRNEGTLAVEVDAPTLTDIENAQRGGLLVVSGSVERDSPAYVVPPELAALLAKNGVVGWQITVTDSGDRIAVMDALAFSRASFLRTSRSRVPEAAGIASIPGSEAIVSVFVDSVADGVEAVSRGARDLLLRGWDSETIGELRDALPQGCLIERTAFPLGVGYDEAAETLDAGAFSAYLNQIDGSGRARPRSLWAPGKDTSLPERGTRVSAAWPDQAWRDGEPAQFMDASGTIVGILERAINGDAPSLDEIEALFAAHGADVEAIADAADTIRRHVVGDDVTFVVNRNINYTNQCYFKCGFCAFSKGPRSLDLRGEPYLMTIDEVVDRSREAWEVGATEVCLQGGIHPGFTGQFYIDLVSAIKHELPDLHVHGYTPLEIWQGAQTAGVTVRDLLIALKEAGLGTLPGTAAEILDDDVRLTLCPDKIRTSQWADVMITAHEIGLRTTSTIMFGHVDGPRSWANHIEVLRKIQINTGGFTEFVPLPFVHMGSPIWLRGQSRPGPTWDEVVLMHAVARIAFVGLIDNIQASWVKLGLGGAEVLLRSGCNDMGGTLMDESISRAAGAAHGTNVTVEDFRDVISDLDRHAVRRTTTYEPIEVGLTIE